MQELRWCDQPDVVGPKTGFAGDVILLKVKHALQVVCDEGEIVPGL
ncbi:hypothetical protein [Saccharopolyspora spinosa]